MLEVGFAIIDSDKLPGGIPLDPIEVLISDVTQRGLDNITFTALLQLKEKTQAVMANAIYAVRREDILLEGYANRYNVKYTAQTCRMAKEDLIGVH